MSAPLAVDDRVIRTERFSFSYPGATLPAVSNLTFTVQRHEIFGFLGPSGAGKSTTQNVLIGLLRGYQGSVNVLGRDLDRVENHGPVTVHSLTEPG
jgi:fluoroquinolone transport system ATP-binding protein